MVEEPTDEAVAALERFVMENDDLLRLEERIGRFNIFDSLGIVRAEIRHSNFLAWLLDPNESHGQGGLFLRAVLMDMLRRCPADLRPLSPIELDGAELRGVRVRREHRNIDILIECDEPCFVVAIENKVDSAEHSDQLQRYRQAVREMHGADAKALFVYLTREGDEPSDGSWTTHTYRDIHSVLERVRKANEGSIGSDVGTFLDHYLNLIGSRFMDDPKIDELCRMIYRNHRRAIDLIAERVGVEGSGVQLELSGRLREQQDKWHVFSTTSRRIDFVPRSWLDWIPPICMLPQADPRFWIRWWLDIHGQRCVLFIQVGPAADPDLQQRVIERLIRNREEFGLRLNSATGKAAKLRSRVFRQVMATWDEQGEPNVQEIAASVLSKMDGVLSRVAGVPEALRPIVDEWRRQNPGRHGALE